MRTWLYNRIKAASGMPGTILERVVSSGGAENPGTPFLAVAMGNESRVLGMTPSTRVQTIPFTVYVHDKPGSMLNIDAAAVALKAALPTEVGAVVGGMSVYNVRWEGTGEDGFDDHFSTNVRPVRFSMMTRRAQ